jgi:hypothetical protein
MFPRNVTNFLPDDIILQRIIVYTMSTVMSVLITLASHMKCRVTSCEIHSGQSGVEFVWFWPAKRHSTIAVL